ncbi:MAG: HypC/HybG/HupF family hydrogenase formation chaperone [bacterium]|jgi:hydrogenase expression/formation protein HypC|nr:HypC/HybG/HupF family hydrogenase formation chaperone [bacterium]
MCLGVPGKIVSVVDEDPFYRMGKVDFSGVRKEISLAYVPEAQVGDYVIVHAGFALNVIDEDEACQVFEYLKEIGEIEEQLRRSDEVPE